jgi:hypothetical protein
VRAALTTGYAAVLAHLRTISLGVIDLDKLDPGPSLPKQRRQGPEGRAATAAHRNVAVRRSFRNGADLELQFSGWLQSVAKRAYEEALPR